MVRAPAAAGLIGRDRELASIAQLVGASRLVTLTGPGGIGKTSLALATFAGSSAGEGWFIDVADAIDGDAVANRVAWAIGLVAAEPAAAEVERYVAERGALLILDATEEVDGLAVLVDAWLDRLAGLRILATSRLPIGSRYEVEMPITGLALPAGDSAREVEDSAAGALFLARARRLGALDVLDEASAADVAAILRRLDGIPLAIELAAGRSRILPPAALLRRLGDRTVVAASGALAGAGARGRHASLASVLDMTVSLLRDDDRALLAGLAVCPGSFDLDLAQAIRPSTPVVPAMDVLVAAGLARRDGELDGEPRFRLLETVRTHQRAGLAPQERAAAQEAHARAIGLVVARLRGRWADDEPGAMHVIVTEDDNIAAAIDWCVEHDPASGLAMLGAIDRFLQAGVQLDRSVRWYRALLDGAARDDPSRAQAMGSLLRLLTRYGGTGEALAMAPEVEEAAAAATGRVRRGLYLRLAYLYHALGEPLEAARRDELAAAASPDLHDAEALRLESRATRAWVTGNLALAIDLTGQAAAAHERAGAVSNAGISRFKQALLELRAGLASAAVDSARHAVAHCPAGNLRAFALEVLALALAERGLVDRAREAMTEAWAIVEREALIDRLEALDTAVALLAAEQRHAEALAALALADRRRIETGWVRDPHVAVIIERWRGHATKTLTSVPASLAANPSPGLTVEAAVAGALAAVPGVRTADRAPRQRDGLTAREVEVLALVGAGRTDAEISAALYISRKTASVHVTNIKGKLGVASRVEVALLARELGLGADAPETPLN